MEIRLEEMREIASTLPIGYYLGRKVPVAIEPGGDAYCDVVKGEIHVGIGLLQQAASQIDAAESAKWNREKLLRCLLYHEVGHLLLTPKDLKNYCWPTMPGMGGYDPDGEELVNVFEDERLEQILSQFFWGVDFKEFVRLLHKSGVRKTRIGDFLKAVRLRQTTPEISAAVDAAIQATADINASTSVSGGEFGLYRDKLTELVSMITPYKEPEQEQQQPQEQEQQDKPEENSGESESENPDEEKPEESSGGGKPEGEKPEEKPEQKPEGAPTEQPERGSADGAGGRMPGKLELPADFLKDLADKVFVSPPSAVQDALKRFAVRLSKRKGAQAAGRWSALHGRIDARRDALDKERIFRRRSDVGESLMSSVHLTLWVDTSGSFRHSQDKLNEILAATSRAVSMSGGKLTVDVVKMGYDATVAPQTDWQIEACGGNLIDSSYTNAWRETRRKDRRNIDLVVFDGACDNAVCETVYCNKTLEEKAKMEAAGYKVKVRGGVKKLKARAAEAAKLLDACVEIAGIWNHPDCHIISDPSNSVLFDRLGKAHVTYVGGDYAEQLREKVMTTLDRIL